jgi:16S rRNA (cytosine967-C5)-methyltransferase
MHLPLFLHHASALLREVFRWSGPVDATVAQYGRQHAKLGARDRTLLADTVYNVLRHRLRLEALAKTGPGERWERLALLGAGEAVTAWAEALSADQTAWLLAAKAPTPTDLPEAQRLNLPPWLIARLRAQGVADLDALAQAWNQVASVDLRVNVQQAKRDKLLEQMRAQDWAVEATPHSPWGLRLAQRRSLIATTWYQSGAIEIQDEGSQLLAALVGAKRGEMVADFCAGAGGKTLAMGAMMRNQGRLYALDTSAHRLEAIKPRLQRAGLSCVYTTAMADEHDHRLQGLAQKMARVLVDAPCSGLGTLRRSPDIKWRLSESEVVALAQQQRSILASAARLVQPGGRLVYATCSVLKEENEDVAQDFSTQHPEFHPLPAEQALNPSLKNEHQRQALCEGGYLRLWPHIHNTDGFFAAVWQRA